MQFGACAGVFLIVIGLAMVLSVPVLTISIDRVSQILQLSSRSLLKSELKRFRLQDIESIDADENNDSDGTFRLVITESDGTVTPLRSHYGPWNRTLQRRLWELAGVSGAIGRDPPPLTTPGY